MPFYPSLPAPREYDNPLTAGIRGLSAGLQVGNQALQTQMYGEALAQEREKREALKEYGQTGDMSKLMSVAPEVGVKMQEAQARQQKVMLEAIKPGLDLAYMMADGMTPENFDTRRSMVVKSFPTMDAILPKAFDEKQIQSMKQSYEKRFKLEQPGGWVYNQATGAWEQAPGPGKVSVARPYETSAEKEARQINVAGAKETMRSKRPPKGKDYTGKLADYDVKEDAEARKINNSYDKKIANLTGSANTIAAETRRLETARKNALADNKKTFANARAKLSGGAKASMSLQERARAELERRRGGGAAAPTSAPVTDDEDEDDAD